MPFSVDFTHISQITVDSSFAYLYHSPELMDLSSGSGGGAAQFLQYRCKALIVSKHCSFSFCRLSPMNVALHDIGNQSKHYSARFPSFTYQGSGLKSSVLNAWVGTLFN